MGSSQFRRPHHLQATFLDYAGFSFAQKVGFKMQVQNRQIVMGGKKYEVRELPRIDRRQHEFESVDAPDEIYVPVPDTGALMYNRMPTETPVSSQYVSDLPVMKMLDDRLAADLLSLNPDRPPVHVVEFAVQPNGTIAQLEPSPTTMSEKGEMKYQTLGEWLAAQTSPLSDDIGSQSSRGSERALESKVPPGPKAVQ